MTSSVFISFILAFIAVCAYYERKTKIVPAPTLPAVRKAMMLALKKYLKKTDGNIAEIGSGWGGLLFAIAQKFPEAQVFGYELSLLPYWVTKLRLCCHRKNITVERKDFFKEDFRGFDAVICYLSPHHMQELKPKFEAELKTGALVISNAFAIPGWTPIETLQGGSLLKIPVYVYRK